MAVYLLHFQEPYKHAQHYIGYADDVESRIKAHRKGKGARLMAVIKEAGIDFEVACIWPDGTRGFERKLKNCNHGPRFCPICNPKGNK